MPIPLIVSTWSFGWRGNDAAWPLLAAGGSSVDAVEKACTVVEDDPEVDSVGYGGLPDRDGNVTLDGCIMLSPAQCGSVCCVRRHLHVIALARRVMEATPHVMLAGDSADAFAKEQGLAEQALLAPEARRQWQQWRADPHAVDQARDRGYARRPLDSGSPVAGRLFVRESDWKHHDTIGVLAIDASGTISGACSTSGTPYKLPGRVGDSPIIGHGLYVDPTAGAAVATGAGELISGVCGAFLVVESMRQGMNPTAAIGRALERIRGSYDLQAHQQVAFIAVQPGGGWASGALRPGYRTSITTRHRSEVTEPDLVLLPD